jgi:hypothetical protein
MIATGQRYIDGDGLGYLITELKGDIVTYRTDRGTQMTILRRTFESAIKGDDPRVTVRLKFQPKGNK